MANQCAKKDAAPPVCAIHRVALVKSEVAIDAVTTIACYVCPVSREVVREG
jgi:hypothetical protein